MKKLQSIYASSYSAVLSIIVTTGLTIAGDLSATFKTWLTGFTGHHWVTKSWVSIIVFVLAFVLIRMIVKEVDPSKTKKAIQTLEVFAILGFVAILGFYLYEFFIK